MDWLNSQWAISLALAYLLGSAPFAYLAGRLIKGQDIRQHGDRNPGANNAYRIIGPRVGVLVGTLDVAKGAGAVLIANAIAGTTEAAMAAGLAVVVGHNWPIFLRLKGGRGAASAVGVFLALVPYVAMPLGVVGFIVLKTLKSTTAAVAIIMVPMALLVWLVLSEPMLAIYSVVLPVLIGLRHYQTTRNQPEPAPENMTENVVDGERLQSN